MEKELMTRETILVVDDSELNRDFLAEILGDKYEVIEAEDGVQALAVMQTTTKSISLILLDMVMPEMDGFTFLTFMNQYGWIESIPVIMITSETGASFVDRAYDLGVTDFINRPFDPSIVQHRVANTIALYTKQRKLANMVAEQIYEREKSNQQMITILSHIVEFRNGESGSHVLHIRIITEMLLNAWNRRLGGEALSEDDISRITLASALHDIGKISIPEEVINKPGRLTDEEFKIMKTHSAIGAEMLNALTDQQDDPLLKTAYEICRWHHERYNGRGYPDGLLGDEIPLSAQIVSIADVYDALTSERCYKKAFSHETAMEMILDGQCGVFNPELLECLKDIEGELCTEIRENASKHAQMRSIQDISSSVLKKEELSAPMRMLRQLDFEQAKAQFCGARMNGIVFYYTKEPSLLAFIQKEISCYDLPETIVDPFHNVKFEGHPVIDTLRRVEEAASQTTAEAPQFQLMVSFSGESGAERIYRCECQSVWSSDAQAEYMGLIGHIFSEKK